MWSVPLAGKPGIAILIVRDHWIFATLLIVKRTILGALMGEALFYLAQSGAPKVPITFHQFAMLCCILQHDYIGYILEKNLPI